MNKEEIKEWLLSDMQQGISDVIAKRCESYNNKFLCPNDVISYLESNGAKDLDQHDSNGWEYDNWHYYMIDDKQYVVQGAGYYGGISFYLNTDSLTESDEEPEEDIENIKPWE